MDEVKQRIACKAVITKDGRALMVREAAYDEGTNAGRWGFPGGRINPGEPFMEGFKREVKEETGLEIADAKPLYVSEWFPVIKGQKNQIVAVFFVCTVASANDDDIQLSEEHDAYRWVTAKDVAELDLMGSEPEALAEYFETTAPAKQ